MKQQGRPYYDVDDMWIDARFIQRMKDGGVTADDIRRTLPVMIEALHGTTRDLPGDVPGIMRLTVLSSSAPKVEWFVDIVDEDRFWAVHAPLKDLFKAFEPIGRDDLAALAGKVGTLARDLELLGEKVRALEEGYRQ